MDGDTSLRRISGIGPAREEYLSAIGIADVVGLASADATSLSEAATEHTPLRPQQIASWIAEAQALCGSERRAATTDAPTPEQTERPTGARREAFVLSVGVDEDGQVSHSGVTHVRSQAEDRWSGWSTARLRSFVEISAAIELIEADAANQEEETATTEDGASAALVPDAAQNDYVIGGRAYTFEYVIDSPMEVEVADDAEDRFAYTANVTLRELGSALTRQLAHTTGNHVTSEELIVPLGDLDLPLGVYEIEMVLETEPQLATPQVVQLREAAT